MIHTNRSSGEGDDGAQLVRCQWTHWSQHMTSAARPENDPRKITCMNTVAGEIDYTRLTDTNHGVRDILACDLTDRLAQRFGRSRE